MAFVDEIGYYAGSTSGKTSEVTQFLTDGVKWVINQIEKGNPELLPLFAQASTLNNSSPTLALTINSRIIDVVRLNADDGTAEALKCSPVNAAYRSNVVNTDSIYYAGKDSPVYYVDNGVLTVKPTPTATQTATISIVLPDASVAGSESAITNFPSDLYHAVILYAAIQLLHNKMAALNSKLPTDLDADTTVFDALSDVSADIALSSVLPTAISMGSTGLPTAITVSSSLPSPIALSSSLPDGITINSSLPSGIAIATGFPTAIDVSSVDLPTIFELSTSIPTIAMPDIASDFQDAMDKAKNLIDDAGGGAFTTTAEGWLVEEDEEMSRATVEVASQELQRASSALGKWQQDLSRAQTGFSADLQKHQEDITKETSRIQSDAARFTTLLGKESSRIETELGKYQAEVQKEGQRVQSDLASYSAEVTKEGQRVQVDTSVYTAELGKEGQRIQAETSLYTTELGLKSTQMQQEVSAFTNLLSKESARVQQESGNYSAELQKESARGQNELAKYNANLQKKITLYTTVISKLSTDYQWLQGQYQVVKQELMEFMAPYTMAGMTDSTVEGVRR